MRSGPHRAQHAARLSNIEISRRTRADCLGSRCRTRAPAVSGLHARHETRVRSKGRPASFQRQQRKPVLAMRRRRGTEWSSRDGAAERVGNQAAAASTSGPRASPRHARRGAQLPRAARERRAACWAERSWSEAFQIARQSSWRCTTARRPPRLLPPAPASHSPPRPSRSRLPRHRGLAPASSSCAPAGRQRRLLFGHEPGGALGLSRITEPIFCRRCEAKALLGLDLGRHGCDGGAPVRVRQRWARSERGVC